jgi:hypothetical protein
MKTNAEDSLAPPPSGGSARRSVDFNRLDAEGRSLMFRAGDLKARFMLIDRCEWLYGHGHKRAACMLMHALEYLKDRLTYELYPWPKNCIPVTFGQDPLAGVTLPQQGPAHAPDGAGVEGK